MADKQKWEFDFQSRVPEVISAVATAADRALEKMGGTAETHAKKKCPVKTGRLKGSITHQRSTSEADTMLVGTNVSYAPFVELGHDQEVGRYVPAIGKRLVASHVDGKPFLKPAIEEHVEEYKEIVRKEFKNA